MTEEQLQQLRAGENEVSIHLKKRAETNERLQLAISSLANIIVLTQKQGTTMKEVMAEAHQGILQAKGIIR